MQAPSCWFLPTAQYSVSTVRSCTTIHHDNLMTSGRLALNDSGAHNDMLYAGDITRTFPVSGKFTTQQKKSTRWFWKWKKQVSHTFRSLVFYYRDVHVATNKIMLEKFVALGILKGNVDDMLEQGVNGMCPMVWVTWLVWMCNDMEDLGENLVGYEAGQERSKMLGLKSLRLARRLEPGFTFTVEPGIYFIPQLIEKFKSDNKYHDFVNYSLLQSYYNLGNQDRRQCSHHCRWQRSAGLLYPKKKLMKLRAWWSVNWLYGLMNILFLYRAWARSQIIKQRSMPTRMTQGRVLPSDW